MPVVQYLMYLATTVFVVGVAYKGIRISSMPMHLRWELYPIPHQRGLRPHGGSYYENVDWWTRPIKFSLVEELLEMAKEIFTMRTLFGHHRALWYYSFPFHLGLYLIVLLNLLLMAGAILMMMGLPVSGSSISFGARSVYYLTIVVGVAGYCLGILGALGLLASRLLRRELRLFSSLSHYFNLLLLLAIFICGFVGWFRVDKSFAVLREIMQAFLAFRPFGNRPTIVDMQLWLGGGFLAYLPFTHMTHFLGKFFTYHRVRWEDKPNLQGNQLQDVVSETLRRPISWRASHIGVEGNWSGAANNTNIMPGNKNT